MSGSKSAVIVGAGIAGLTTALRLRQAGWRTTVVERSPYLRPGGFVVEFSGLGHQAAERMGLLPALEERRVTYDSVIYLHGSGQGARVSAKALKALTAGNTFKIMRGDIVQVLLESLGTDAVRYGTTLRSVRQDPSAVEVELSDGDIIRCDLLVGADGVHSAVRQLVFGPEEIYRVDLDHMIAVQELDDAPEGIPPDSFVSFNESRRQVTVTHLTGGRTVALYGYHTPSPAADLERGARASLTREFGNAAWLIPEFLRRLPADDTLYFDAVSQIRMKRWHRGRVVLVGDSAWCVSLFAGYGSSLALGGADLLATALDAHENVTEALTAWSRDLRPMSVSKKQRGVPLHTFLSLLCDPGREIELFRAERPTTGGAGC